MDYAAADRSVDAVPASCEGLDPGVQHDVDSLVLERRLQLSGRLGVCARGNLRSRVHDRHPGAEAGEDLRELEAHGPRADDEQRLGHLFELERADMVDPLDVADA